MKAKMRILFVAKLGEGQSVGDYVTSLSVTATKRARKCSCGQRKQPGRD